MDILEQIAAVKREEVKHRKITAPVSLLEKSSLFGQLRPSFYEALVKPMPSVIGEFKRRSPSKGPINLTADAETVARGYLHAGISAISVLTDEQFFGGSNQDLVNVAGTVDIPLLRKDFVIDEYQVIEAKATGASAILLIAAMLTGREADKLAGLAEELGLDVLFEIHSAEDLGKMNDKIRITGVNNRNLRSFEVSMANSEELLSQLPKDCIKVAESGFSSATDVKKLFENGYDAFLIGENFMKAQDPGKRAAEFMEDLRKK
jgi:indole-3-glycerol phosphate synthase